MSSNRHTNKWRRRWCVATPRCTCCGWFGRSTAFNPESRIHVLQVANDDNVWTAGSDGSRMSQIGAGGSRISPLETNVKLCATYGQLLSHATLDRQLVGSLIYLTMTRLDLAYAAHLVSQLMTAPCLVHYVAASHPSLHEGHFVSWFTFQFFTHHQAYMYIQMLIGLVIPLIVIPPRVIVSYLVILSFLGVTRNSLLLPALTLKMSIVFLLTPPLGSSGYVGFYTIWAMSQTSKSAIT